MKNQPIIFYPSVSSVAKNRLSILEHIEILTALNYPHFLISAFDIFYLSDTEKEKFYELQKQLASHNTDIIVDSGVYEKVWTKNNEWSFENYKRTINTLKYNFVFNFDDYLNPKDIPLDKILESIKNTDILNLSPILHASKIEYLPDLCLEVAKIDEVDIIAIPERELGNGIIEGIKTIAQIRQKLSTLDKYKKIHILGTGNPISILLYSAFGVDSFDGLDWCQTVVDFESATLHHSLQLDFYAYQSKLGGVKDLSYHTKLFAHNLEFYLSWMQDINKEIDNSTIMDMIQYYVPKSILHEISSLYKEHHESTN